MKPTHAPIPPIRKRISVPWSVDAAFQRFTAGISAWWPTRTHSVGGERTEKVVFETQVGGRIYECIRGGEESTWGTILAYDPPNRILFTWHPGQPESLAQEVEVRFFAEPTGGTRLELTHSKWERLGSMAKRARRGYPIGWAYVLQLWADRRRHPTVLVMNSLLWVTKPLHKRIERRIAAGLREAVAQAGDAVER